MEGGRVDTGRRGFRFFLKNAIVKGTFGNVLYLHGTPLAFTYTGKHIPSVTAGSRVSLDFTIQKENVKIRNLRIIEAI